MKKLEGRAILCLTLVAALVVGMTAFLWKMFQNGPKWASFYGNGHIYREGHLTVGSVYDRNGLLLLENTREGTKYNEDRGIRLSTLHLIGDKGYNISTAVNTALRNRLVGYNFVTGTGGLSTKYSALTLTVDGKLNRKALEALGWREGFASVYNWKTGEILCLVSAPTLDPTEQINPETLASGTYINKVLSAKFTPGSIFKIVTTEAALENIKGLDRWTFKCTGSYEIDGEKITCPKVHGTNDIYGALSNSCNCAFAALGKELGADVLESYAEKSGLTESYDLNGIKVTKGSFDFHDSQFNLGWSAIGQFKNQVNPLSMMIYLGAIAGEGTAAKPTLIKGEGGGKVHLLEKETARKLSDMLRNNVKANYGDANFPGLELHAKSGTAEMVKGEAPNAWFVGYSGDFAFVVCVERGGAGAQAAGPVANTLLQYLKNNKIQ